MAVSATGLGEVADLASTVIARIWPDKTEQEKAELSAALLVVQGQLQVNAAVCRRDVERVPGLSSCGCVASAAHGTGLAYLLQSWA
jgi:hypothetical protein